MLHSQRVATVAVAVLIALLPAARAGDLIGVSEDSPTMIRVDTTTGAKTTLGPIAIVNPAVFTYPWLARAPSGRLYAIALTIIPAPIPVYGNFLLYEIHEPDLSVTLLMDLGMRLPSGLAISPVDDSIWFIGIDETSTGTRVYHVDPLTSQITSSSIGLASHSYFDGLTFDDQGRLYTLGDGPVAGGGQYLWRIDTADPAGAGSGPIGPLGVAVSSAFSLVWDASDQRLLGYTSSWPGVLYEVDRITGAATVLTPVDGPPLLTVAAAPCPSGTRYGQGCSGSGMFVPSLDSIGCLEAGGPGAIRLTRSLGGTQAILFFGQQAGAAPVNPGCTLLVAPLPPVSLALTVGGAGPGAGNTTVYGTYPPSASGVSFTVQAFTADPGAPGGFAASNGLRIDVP